MGKNKESHGVGHKSHLNFVVFHKLIKGWHTKIMNNRDWPYCNLFGFTDKKLCSSVYVGNEERQDNVNSKEHVYYVVCDAKVSLWWGVQKRDFEGVNPRRVCNQKHHKWLPPPELANHTWIISLLLYVTFQDKQESLITSLLQDHLHHELSRYTVLRKKKI